jgi:hypothetical protein
VGQPFVFVRFLWIPDPECVAKEVREGNPVNRNGQGGWAGKRVAPRFHFTIGVCLYGCMGV